MSGYGVSSSTRIITAETWYYLAGLFEGEGCVSADAKRPNQIRLHITMTDLDVLQGIQRHTGLGSIKGPFLQENRKPKWTWRVDKRKDVVRLLCGMAPLLRTRRRARILELLEKCTTKARVVFCRNPDCDQVFATVHINKAFCDKACGSRFSALKHYNEHYRGRDHARKKKVEM